MNNMNKVLGLMLLVAGIVLAVIGVNESDSVASEVSEFFSGSPTDRSIWMMIGGFVMCAAGLGMLLYVPRRT